MTNYIIMLYKKYLLNDITQDEFKDMRHCLNEDDDAIMTLMEETWLEDDNHYIMNKTSREDILHNLDFYIHQGGRKKKSNYLLKIAVVVLPLFIASIGLFMVLNNDNSTKRFAINVEAGNKASIVLPDSSRVRINSNSELEYHTNKNGMREATLTGEAFFKIAKDEKHPFTVKADGIILEVLGTSFNVKARKETEIIEASLVEGSIRISGESLPHSYYLKPNEKAVYNKKEKELQIIETDNRLETAWIHNKLQFRSKRFCEVLEDIGLWYGVTIISKYNQIDNDLVSGSFNEENLETAMGALQVQYNIKYTKRNDTIYVYKK